MIVSISRGETDIAVRKSSFTKRNIASLAGCVPATYTLINLDPDPR